MAIIKNMDLRVDWSVLYFSYATCCVWWGIYLLLSVQCHGLSKVHFFFAIFNTKYVLVVGLRIASRLNAIDLMSAARLIY